MKAVLDVSAAYALIMNANDTKLIQQVLAEADLVKSPDLFIAEASNTAWKYHRFRGLSEEQ
ncbi:MAG: PIN domain nuclease, partial [Bacteroidota bacterium]